MSKPLPDKLDSNARVEVRVDGVVVGTRRIIDFITSGVNSDDGVNDVVKVVMSGGSGDSLWEETGGDLQPISSPTAVIIPTTTGSITLEPGQDIDLTPARDLNVTTTQDANEIIGRDNNMTVTRDWNLSAGREANLAGTTRALVSASAGDVNIEAANGQIDIHATTGDVYLGTFDGQTNVYAVGATNVVEITSDDGIHLDAGAGGLLTLTNLPTSDPGVSGALWNSSGVLHISP